MKRISISTMITAVLALSVLAMPAAAQNGPGGGNGGGACGQILVDELALLPVGELDEEEEADILFLREEEKLARDVYLSLSLSWELPIFSRIARSEQQHLTFVGLLLSRHGLEDPAADDRVGVFTNPDLEQLFFELVEAGKASLADALTVGAIIEDMDIFDLETMLESTDELDMALVAYNLDAGSHNHLRAFAKALAELGLSYEPRYISLERYEEILGSEPERGVIFNEFGDVLAECGNQGGQGGNGGSGGGNGDGNGDCDGTGSGGSGDCDGTGAGGNGGNGGNGGSNGNGGNGGNSGNGGGNGGGGN